jgi:chemotaxis protein methyltransferase CheR
MTPRLFQRFSEIAYAQAGIRLRDGKEALVAARVAQRMRALGVHSEAEYLAHLEADPTGAELVGFLDAIATNFTGFFREPSHFDELARTLRQRVADGATSLRLWSAASSTGQEPYSMAITVAEAVGGASLDWRILATDISTRALTCAEAGIYDEFAITKVHKAHRQRYFRNAEPDPAGRRRWQVLPALRSHVVFRRLNLARLPLPMHGPMDAVFCRNVMIYFDDPVRRGLVSEIERLLAPEGLLCIGHSETLTRIDTRLKLLRPSVYTIARDAPSVRSRTWAAAGK